MIDWIAEVNDRINENLDRLAVLPLAFVVVLSFFVAATAILETDLGSVAAAKLALVAG